MKLSKNEHSAPPLIVGEHLKSTSWKFQQTHNIIEAMTKHNAIALISHYVLRHSHIGGATITTILTVFFILSFSAGALAQSQVRIYLSSPGTNEVLRYNSGNGVFEDAFVSEGEGGLETPTGIAFGPDSNFYVASEDTDEVLRFDRKSGDFIDVFVTAGSGGLNGPRGITFRGNFDLYVSSINTDEVLKYDAGTGEFIEVFITAGNGGLDNPFDVTFAPDGWFYVVSQGTNQVIRYTGTSGQFLGNFMTPGSGGLSDPTVILFFPSRAVEAIDGNCSLADTGTKASFPWLLIIPLALLLFIRRIRIAL